MQYLLFNLAAHPVVCAVKYLSDILGHCNLTFFFFFCLVLLLLLFVVVVAISWAASAAYGGSQARG